MPKEFSRNRRVAQLLKKELSILIHEKFTLKEYGLITLTNVDVSPDLKNSKIFVTSLNCKESNSKLIDRLNQQASYFRYEISKLLTSKTVPSLSFKYDQSIERGQRLSNIIETISNRNEETERTEEKN
jgi:ribosome-binding factor A|tara:strand:- start:133 stop:516 length:384 start_codon:yes stop_codon:yes gene_type:complete